MAIAKTGTITITADGVSIDGFEPGTIDSELFTCRTFMLEALGWAIEKLGSESRKAAAFYASGIPTENVSVD